MIIQFGLLIIVRIILNEFSPQEKLEIFKGLFRGRADVLLFIGRRRTNPL
jgi:hypothetical protein